MIRSVLSHSLLASTLLTSPFAFAQTTAPATGGPAAGGAPGGGGTTTGPTGTTPSIPGTGTRNPTNPFPNDRSQQPSFEDMRNRPIFLSGKVRMEDGTPPPEPATIERICMGRGTPVPEAYTDSKGNFSFQVGQRAGMMPDASVSNTSDAFGGRSGGIFDNNPMRSGVSEREIMTCEIRASLPGFRSSVVSLAGRRSLDNPDVGIIILRRLGDVTGFTTSATTLMAPKEARKSLEKARTALKKNKLPDARKELELAVAAHPRFAEAWYELGRVQSLQNDNEAALSSYQKSIEADDKFVRPYLGMAVLAAASQKWVDVRQLTEKVIRLNRYDFPAAFFYGAVASYNLRDSETAEKLCRAGIEADQYHTIPKMSHLLGMILADKQDFKGASEQLSAYLKFAPKANDFEQVKQQLADFTDRVAKSNP